MPGAAYGGPVCCSSSAFVDPRWGRNTPKKVRTPRVRFGTRRKTPRKMSQTKKTPHRKETKIPPKSNKKGGKAGDSKDKSQPWNLSIPGPAVVPVREQGRRRMYQKLLHSIASPMSPSVRHGETDGSCACQTLLYLQRHIYKT